MTSPQAKLTLNLKSFDGDDVDHEEFDPSDKWPRRLLNLQTMVSHKWEPGNTYGGITEPKYAILSYTWGRWRLRDSERPDVAALSVTGTPWKIPRIHPDHFTAAQFRNVLRHIAENRQGFYLGDHYYDAVITPFVWLDVACIPQWRHSAVGALEIGRQARIFRGARRAYVWLTTFTPADLEPLTMNAEGVYETSLDTLLSTLRGLRQLLRDPWFGSMWTLQESFIQQGAYIVTSSGFQRCSPDSVTIVPRAKEVPTRPVHLGDMSSLAGQYLAIAANPWLWGDLFNRTIAEPPPGLVGTLAEFRDQWRRAGLGRGAEETSPVEVLAAAAYRQCSHPPDQVYGIMQIFGDDFVVGRARRPEDASSGREFTLEDLDDELGTLILQRHPVMGQLFQHHQAPLLGKAWRINRHLGAVFPDSLRFVMQFWVTQVGREDVGRPEYYLETSKVPEPSCQLSTTTERRDGSSLTWATFEGVVAPFQVFPRIFRSATFPLRHLNLDVYLDQSSVASNGVAEATFFKSKNKFVLMDEDDMPVMDRSRLFHLLQDDALSVLLLSAWSPWWKPPGKEISGPPHYQRSAMLIGLLLLKPGESALGVHKSRRDWGQSRDTSGGHRHWARVGVCVITYRETEDVNDDPQEASMEGPEIDILRGCSPVWEKARGIWG